MRSQAEREASRRLHAAEVARYIAATPDGPPVYTVHPDHDAAEQHLALVKAELARLGAIPDAP